MIRRQLRADRECRSRAVVWDEGAGAGAAPGAGDEEEFVGFGEAGGARTEDVEALALEFAQEFPIDAAHQFGAAHGAAVFGWEKLSRGGIMLTGASGDGLGYGIE